MNYKEYYQNNKEKKLEYAKKYRTEHESYYKQYRSEHKNEKKQYSKLRYTINVTNIKKQKIQDILSNIEHRKIETNDGKIYFVTSDGRFFNETKEMQGSVSSNGYQIVKIGKSKLAHRVVWESFNGEIPKGMEIDHKNTVRDDNRLENLRLVTSKENKNNPITKERYKESNKNKIGYDLSLIIELKKKKVYQYTIDGELVKVWDSAYECGRNGFNVNCVRNCCNNRQHTHKNFKWSYEKYAS